MLKMVMMAMNIFIYDDDDDGCEKGGVDDYHGDVDDVDDDGDDFGRKYCVVSGLR